MVSNVATVMPLQCPKPEPKAKAQSQNQSPIERFPCPGEGPEPPATSRDIFATGESKHDVAVSHVALGVADLLQKHGAKTPDLNRGSYLFLTQRRLRETGALSRRYSQ